MPDLPELHWYDNPILLWIVELIALGAVLGAIGRDRSVAFDVFVFVVSLVAFVALNVTIGRRRANRT